MSIAVCWLYLYLKSNSESVQSLNLPVLRSDQVFMKHSHTCGPMHRKKPVIDRYAPSSWKDAALPRDKSCLLFKHFTGLFLESLLHKVLSYTPKVKGVWHNTAKRPSVKNVMVPSWVPGSDCQDPLCSGIISKLGPCEMVASGKHEFSERERSDREFF